MISTYAHSVKNPEIIHYIHNRRYVCNSACSTTKIKSTKDPLSVTCENCIRKLSKGVRYKD
jgi:hypothetical protein